MLLLVLFGLLRAVCGARASSLVEHEAEARERARALMAASQETVAGGRPHPGLRGAFLARFPELRARPELGGELISYADDGEYLYGLATASSAEAAGPRQGFVLRAWPLRFGSSGDIEFQAGDDGILWEGMNCLGRSGTDTGFPPPFPDPDLQRRDAGWVPLEEPIAAHR